jgi:hypothetical protein
LIGRDLERGDEMDHESWSQIEALTDFVLTFPQAGKCDRAVPLSGTFRGVLGLDKRDKDVVGETWASAAPMVVGAGSLF